MQRFLFTILSKLPLPVLYFLSDVLYIVLYWLIGYRKGIVTRNLSASFPEMQSQDVFFNAKKYYRHLCDLIVETIKTISISDQEIRTRVEYNNGLLIELLEQGKSGLVVTSHLGNWEWMGARQAIESDGHSSYIIYKKIKNEAVESIMKQARQRLGNNVVEMAEVPAHMASAAETPRLTAFIADQTPSAKNAYWLTFLNQETAVFRGVAIYAKRYNLPIIYGVCKKKKRGRYVIDFELLTMDASSLSVEEILSKYMNILEGDIKEQIPYWLWSHRRWKHKRPENS